MNKLILIVLISLSVLSFVASESSTADCKSHPVFAKAKNLLNVIFTQDKRAKHVNKVLQKRFKENSPKSLSNDDLGSCSAFSGQKTCCDKNMVKLIDQAALLKVKPILQTKSAFSKFINVYIAQLNKSCSPTVIPSPPLIPKAIYADKTLKVLSAYKQAQGNCKIKFAQALSAFTRGSLCSICMGVDKLSDYINSQGQLKITQQSVNIFQQAADEAITCFANIFAPSNLDSILNELNAAYIKNNDSCAANVSKNVKSIFSNPKISNDDGQGGKICKGTSMFSDNSQCEQSLLGDSALEYTNPRILNFKKQVLRLLAVNPDAVVDQNGVNVFVSSPRDQVIDESGRNITFSFILKNSQMQLAYATFFALISFIF
ncbi:hypothetical protein TTHERM_00370660 (macronuclear) [Tetrahymena thermophila SB210]|uniref:Transmembrane protein n=1 Tax=Tetrahymena thermophila (strain SB210) TaxID=312017 RepID=I7MHN5_TETTS|nr:hypothetical protein TTHERM_00370660 [Tetrahymena thermophila SB210]EAR89251.1 hypothetical protein TTHERM_00370660 [Tetrahymena thermophila SB210]|eukprot:XP_001009496.1 hypothetical protein TTHERM_00370660 [Tetrahymena thermophila SB210]